KAAIEQQALTPSTLPQILTTLETRHTEARNNVAALGAKIEYAIKHSFTTSITQIYQNAIWLVVVSFAVILLLLDEIPLRKSNRDMPPVTE
ncbi:MAG: hypothetical protein ACKO83_07795, partial [Roseiflexaceae bacterium]